MISSKLQNVQLYDYKNILSHEYACDQKDFNMEVDN